MRPDNAVPDVQQLKRFLLGQLSGAEAESVEHYLEQHPDSATTLADLAKDDTLISSLRQAAGQPVIDPPELVGLMEKLSQVRLSSHDVTVGMSNGDSVSGEAGEVLAPPQGPEEIGRLGRYRVVKLLGAGGMGMVYQAEDIQLQRPVALKVMKPELAKNVTARERFLREARAAARIKSDYVVTIHQVEEDRQVVFLAMEFLEGMSLEDWLKKGRKPSLAQAARIGRQIALGLAAAHERGLIHRDIKPGNVWLESSHQGRAKLLDFGLARGDADEVHLTQSGAIIGTPAYMAPEQARGEKVDQRCDLFSLGVVLYRLTTGQLPFRGDNTMSLLTALALDTPRSPRSINPAIPPRLEILIERLLAKDRTQRPQTAKAVADELAVIEREAAQPATDDRTVRMERPVSVREPATQPARFRSRLGWLVAASVLLFGGIVAAIVVIIRDKDGKKIAEIEVPDKGSVEIKDNGKGKEEAKKAADVKEEKPIRATLLPPLLARGPLASNALVRKPAKLPGMRSWSIETRNPYAPTTMAYAPDGKRLAVGSGEGLIRIWEPDSGRLMQILFSPSGCSALTWAPDGRRLAVGVMPRRPLPIWDAYTGQLIGSFESPDADTRLLGWSPDGQTLLALTTEGNCIAWDAAGKLIRKKRIPCTLPAVLSPDAKLLAGQRDEGGRVALWDTETGRMVRMLGSPASPLTSLVWRPDGKRLAVGEEKKLEVWDGEAGRRKFELREANAGYLAWSPDGRSLVYNLPGNQGVATLRLEAGAKPQRLEEAGGSFLAWSPDGKTIARTILHGSYRVSLYDAATGQRLRSLSEGSVIGQVALSVTGSSVALTDGWGPSNQTYLASMDNGQVHAVLKETGGPLAWSPDGTTLAAGGPEHGVVLWSDGGKARHVLKGHQSHVNWLAWSPDGKRLASSSDDEKRILLWDADKGEKSRELGPFPAAARSLSCSPDGRLLIFAMANEVGWHFWDVEKNQLANDPKQWPEAQHSFSPDGRWVLTANFGSTYIVRDRATGKATGRVIPLTAFGHLAPAVWSPDSQLVAVPVDWGVELWHSDLSRRVRTLPSTYRNVEQLVFSRDGKLVAGLAGERLHLWETDTGRLRGIQLLGEKNNGFTITPDGHYGGNERVDRGIVVVLQKDDGTQEVLEPGEFEQKFGFKNEPEKVHLLQPLPPSLYPLPGQPMGPLALVREPAELPDTNSWTLETRNARGLVRALAYHPDGKLLATGGEDGTIRVWNPATGELVRLLIGEPVRSLSWSKDGILAGTTPGGTTHLWEVDTGRLLRRLPISASDLAWSPDGRTLATLGIDGWLRLWDATAEQSKQDFTFKQVARQLAWSPDGKTIAVGLDDKSLRLWDVASGKEVRKLEGHNQQFVYGLFWSPDGRRLGCVTNPGDDVFYIWDVASGQFQGQVGSFPKLDRVPDGKAVANGKHGLFDADNAQRPRALDGGVAITCLAFAPDGKQVVTAGLDGVRLHDTATGKRTHTLEESRDNQRQISSVSWSPRGQSLVLGFFQAPTLRIMDTATGRELHELSKAAHLAAWSPDGKTLAAKGSGHTVVLCDATTFRLGGTLEGGGNLPLTVMAWSPDSKMLAAGGEEHVWVWSGRTGKLLWHHDKQDNVTALAWSPNSRELATTEWGNNGANGAVHIWQSESGQLLHEAPVPAYRLAWSPNGKTIAAAVLAGGEHTVALLDTTGKVLARSSKVVGSIEALRWSSDGKSFVTASARYDGTQVCVWDGEHGAHMRTARLPWLIPPDHAVAWAPDGRLLAWSNDRALYLATADGHPLGVLLPQDSFGQLAITADGHYRGNARVERLIRMVVQKSDGTSETLTPLEFEQKYSFKNDPAKVRLLGE